MFLCLLALTTRTKQVLRVLSGITPSKNDTSFYTKSTQVLHKIAKKVASNARNINYMQEAEDLEGTMFIIFNSIYIAKWHF